MVNLRNSEVPSGNGIHNGIALIRRTYKSPTPPNITVFSSISISTLDHVFFPHRFHRYCHHPHPHPDGHLLDSQYVYPET
jgi:hypothetical protein